MMTNNKDNKAKVDCSVFHRQSSNRFILYECFDKIAKVYVLK